MLRNCLRSSIGIEIKAEKGGRPEDPANAGMKILRVGISIRGGDWPIGDN